MNKDTSPRATGPAGAQFEAKVATHYALAVLAKTEAFGLPGAIVERIEFQRRAQGYPLDDIIIKGETGSGEERCLEIQAKRSIAFTEGNKEFAGIVKDMVMGHNADPNRMFAVAIERTSGPIENGVQEVLELAHVTTTVESFLALLYSPGRGNPDMKRFVEAFRKHLSKNKIAADEILFQLLKGFFVLVFDYARPQSIAEHHDRMRAQQLTSKVQDKDPYDTLFGWILRSDAIGGETDRLHLTSALREHGIEISGARSLTKARGRIEEMSRFALSDINTEVAGCQLVRANRRQEVTSYLDEAEVGGSIVEITGPGGAGKSALLKAVAEARSLTCRIVVLAPDRTPSGGWVALRNEIDIDASAGEFFEDLSCDGGGLICIDGLDRFRDIAQRKTVLDVIRSALGVKGMTVLFTSRSGWEEEAVAWLDDDIVEAMSLRKTIKVEGLNDEEASALAEAAPSLAPLLNSDHPARNLARNPFILRRLVRTRLNAEAVLGEASLARDWWASGAHGIGLTYGAQRARRRVLVEVCEALTAGNALADVSHQTSDAVASLISDDVLVEIGATDRVRFKHDLLTDWALACFFAEDSSHTAALDLNAPPPFWLSRGLELSSRLLAEGEDVTAWPSYLEMLEGTNAQNGWVGLVLLALVRSEHADTLLSRYSSILLHDRGDRAAILLRRAIASHGQSAGSIFRKIVPADTPIPEGCILPDGPVWLRLILWSVSQFDMLPSQALSASIDLFEKWVTFSIFGEDVISPRLLECFSDLLVAHIEDRDYPLPKPGDPLPKIRYPVSGNDVKTVRLQLSLLAQRAPTAVERYLNAVADSSHAADELYEILQFPGNLPAAAPSAFVSAFLSAVEKDREAFSEVSGRDRIGPDFPRLDGPFVLGKAGIALFAALLNANSKEGMYLIRSLVEEAEKAVGLVEGDEFDLSLLGETRIVSSSYSYGWSRVNGPSTLLYKALAALEHWGHQQIDSSESLDKIVRKIAGEGQISGALLLIITDLVLSHSKLDGGLLIDLISSPEVLVLDARRLQYDSIEQMSSGSLSIRTLQGNQNDQAIEKDLSERASRGIALHDTISQVVFRQAVEATTELRSRLSEAVDRLGAWMEDSVNWNSPSFLASHALRLSFKENYERVNVAGPDGDERKGWQFRWPEGQQRWLQTQGAKVTAESKSFNRGLAIRMDMDSDKSSLKANIADAENVLEETKEAIPGEGSELHDPNDPWINRVAAGAYLARFGDAQKMEVHRTGLIQLFDMALISRDGISPNLRYDVMYDPRALAIAGLLYLEARFEVPPAIRSLFDAITSFPESAVAVFTRHPAAVQQLGEQIIRSAVRIGIESCIFPRRAHYDEDEGEFDRRKSLSENNLEDRLAKELSWLDVKGQEPIWPSPPPRRSRRSSRGVTFPGAAKSESNARLAAVWPNFYFDDRTAAVWLQVISQLGNDGQAVIAALLRDNWNWLVRVNGVADDGEDNTDLEQTWTRGLLECAGGHAKFWSVAERQALVFDLLAEFSDEAFIDSAAAFLLQSDLSHIEGDATDTAYLVGIREQLWARLSETHRWRQHLWSPKSGMEIHLNDLISAFFLKVSHGFGSRTAYTDGLVDDQLTLFFPILTEVVVAASPCPTIALLFLDILEIVDCQVGEPFLAAAASCWVADADVRFLNELGIGRRVCKLAENAGVKAGSVQQWLRIADAISAAGVAEGEELKQLLREEFE